MIGTERWNRYVAQMYCVPLTENLEKLFGRGNGLLQGTMVSLSNRLWESEIICAMNIDVLET